MKTLTHIPILETGIEYQTSTGAYTFTAEDLADMVESQSDAAIVVPRLKLGHTDPRFNGADGEPLFLDGEPAFGVAQNLTLENNGNTVYCDYVGVPNWLADILPFVYPNRSIEGLWDVETVTGHKWRFVCTDVSLLGVVWPGISTLDDLEVSLSDAGPEGVEVTTVAAASAWERFASKQLQAQVNLEDVRRQFYEEIATQETGRYWWWVRAVLIEPDELICDDDDGGLFRVPFEINNEAITFGDPVPVKINYVDNPEPDQVAAGRVMAATYQSPPTDRRKEVPQPKKTLANVDLTLLRKVLGLKDDATEDEVNAALNKAGEDPKEPATEPTATEPETEPTETEPAAEPASAAELAASGTVTIDKGTLEDLQRRAGLGVQAFERGRIADRDDFLASALAAGKFPPSSLPRWTQAWETEFKVHGNADTIKATIEAMPAGLIPVSQIGGLPLGEASNADPYPAHWLPEVQRRKAMAASTSRITQEA